MNNDIPELSDLAKSFRPGIYKHFKGGMYEALCVARDTEAAEKEIVVYRSLDNGNVWARSLTVFMDEVDREGYKGPRFVWQGEK